MSNSEDVRNLVRVEEAVQPRPPQYKSKFPGKVDPKQVPSSLLGVKQVRATATMGPGSGGVLVDPSHFLLKHEGEPELPPPGKPAPKLKLKEPVPKRSERPQMGLSSSKDFVASNVVEVPATVPMHPQLEEVRYVLKPWFGEVPPYLRQRCKELEEQRRQTEEPAEEGTDAAAGNALCGAELEELVRHLKLKWQSVNEAYQRLPMVLDTPSKKRRKEEMEAQLAEIERDVKLLQKATVVHVY